MPKPQTSFKRTVRRISSSKAVLILRFLVILVHIGRTLIDYPSFVVNVLSFSCLYSYTNEAIVYRLTLQQERPPA